MENPKDQQTGTVRGCVRTTNPGVTRKPDNIFKLILNTFLKNPDNPLKGIWNIVPNRILIQCLIISTVTTYNRHKLV